MDTLYVPQMFKCKPEKLNGFFVVYYSYFTRLVGICHVLQAYAADTARRCNVSRSQQRYAQDINGHEPANSYIATMPDGTEVPALLPISCAPCCCICLPFHTS